jgi:putative ABC transport system permease protein
VSRIRRWLKLESPRRDVIADIDDELRFHFAMREEELRSSGFAGDDAHREAVRRFGDVERVREGLTMIDRERIGQAHRTAAVGALWQDGRYALRGLRKTPGFTLGVVLTFAIGIGANATMFEIVDRLLLRPPAYLRDPSLTGRIYTHRPRDDGSERIDRNLQYRRYLDLTETTRTLAGAAAFYDDERIVGLGTDARTLHVSLVSGSFWGMFDARPALGRFFTVDEDRPPNGTTVTVLGYEHWRTAYGSDPHVLGKPVRIGARDFTVIGVAPPGFTGTAMWKVAAFIPLSAGVPEWGADAWHMGYNLSWLEILGRRRPDATIAQVNAELTRLYRTSLETERLPARTIALSRAQLAPVLADRGPEEGDSAKVATWLAGVALAVLLIACANVANLLLARSLRRRREIAVRRALGVSRGRLLTQLLTESTLLAIFGAIAGLALARFGGGMLRSTLLPDVDWSLTPLFDARILGFAALATVLTGLLAGLAPAAHAVRDDVNSALKAGGREGSRQRTHLRGALLVAQAALSVLLLVGAGLFVRSLRNVHAVNLGYDADKVLLASLDMRGTTLPPPERTALRQRLLERARQLPGVSHASTTASIPFWQTITEDVFLPGRDSVPRGDYVLNAVRGDYFAAMGTRIVQGRATTDADRATSPLVAVVSQSMAKLLWPGRSALGQCVKIGADTAPCREVVGVAQDIVFGDMRSDTKLLVYTSAEQYRAGGTLVLRSESGARFIAETARRELQQLAPGAAFINVRTLDSNLAPLIRPWQLGATMFTIFGMLALVVAAIGLYGVIAYNVTQRSHEMGLRLALGAGASDVVRLILGDGLRVAAIGIALGIGGALLAGKYIAPLLFEVSPRDVTVLSTVAVTLAVVATAASLIPAWRASRVDPNIALRTE